MVHIIYEYVYANLARKSLNCTQLLKRLNMSIPLNIWRTGGWQNDCSYGILD